MPKRSSLRRFGLAFRDYAVRVWDNSGEDNVLFLAGGIAYNIILTAVPFVLLLVAVAAYLLPHLGGVQVSSTSAVLDFIDRLLPTHSEDPNSPIHKALTGILHTRKSIGIYSGIGFIWFSTRLFGSLRTVLASVFDIEIERGIIQGKIFDVKITVIATLLFVASTALETYLAIATTQGVRVLETLGLRHDVMGSVEYWIGRGIAFGILALMFFALYRFLPVRRVRRSSAWVAALFTSVMFEAARDLFDGYSKTFNPASVYTGTLTAFIVVMIWFYYAALIFILGGEVGQVYELKKVRAMQREVFSDPVRAQ